MEWRTFMVTIIFLQYQWLHSNGDWPISDPSNIQLLGLFAEFYSDDDTIRSAQFQAMFRAATILSQKYNITINGNYVQGQIAQTGDSVIGAIANTCAAISKFNIVGIVGPALSREAAIIAQYSGSVGIPAISYSVTSSYYSNRYMYRNFYRTCPSDESAVLSIVDLFLRFNWTSTIVIYQNDQYGTGFLEVLNSEFYQRNLTITKQLVFDVTTLTLPDNFEETLINNPTRVVILWVFGKYMPSILTRAIDGNVLGPQFTWILAFSISFESFKSESYSNLVGLLSIESTTGSTIGAPINTTLLNDAYDIWKQYEPHTFPGAKNVDVYALFIFDATWALILSLQQNCLENMNQSSFCGTLMNVSTCYDRRFPENNSLLNTIDGLQFLGISGAVSFNKDTTGRNDGIYYLIRNVEVFADGPRFLPKLTWSQTDYWKEYLPYRPIVWPGNSFTVPTSYVGLSGVPVRICYMESEPFTVQSDMGNNETKFTGYIPDLLDELIKRTNLIPNITLLPINKTYYQYVEDAANGVCDMAIGDITITAKRREIADFSQSIFDNSLSIIIRKSNSQNFDLSDFLKPFTPGLWLVLLATIAYGGLLVFLIEAERNEALKDRSVISSIFLSLWYSIGTVFGYGVDFHVQTAAGRMLTVGLYILSLISVAAYTANLASYLTTLKQKEFISGLEDIMNGKVLPSRIGIVPGSSIEEFYLREISKGVRNFHALKSPALIPIELLNNRIDVAIGDTPFLQYLTNSIYCNLTIVGSELDRSTFGIAVSKNWIYKQNLDVAILSARESGAMERLKEKWFTASDCEQSSGSNTINMRLGVESLGGLFITFAAISSTALIAFLWTKRLCMKGFIFSLFSGKKSSKEKSVKLEQNSDATMVTRI